MKSKVAASLFIFVKIACFFSLVFFTCDAQDSSSVYSIRNRSLLERTPEYFWNENKLVFHWGHGPKPIVTRGGFQTKGSAGIIPYYVHLGKIYVLLSRETWGVDRHTYCDLGGAVEAYGNENEIPTIDTFLFTLMKESTEESGALYELSDTEILDQAYVISCIHHTNDKYDGFESIIAFCQVEAIYFTEQFLESSKIHAKELADLGLCPWGYQEKDDYQWIPLDSFYSFLCKSQCNEGIFENILGEIVTLKIRAHLADTLRAEESLQVLSKLLIDSFNLVDEMYLYSEGISKKKALASKRVEGLSPRGTTAMPSYKALSLSLE